MGGAAWYDLTNNMPPGHVYSVKSRYTKSKLLIQYTKFCVCTIAGIKTCELAASSYLNTMKAISSLYFIQYTI